MMKESIDRFKDWLFEVAEEKRYKSVERTFNNKESFQYFFRVIRKVTVILLCKLTYKISFKIVIAEGNVPRHLLFGTKNLKMLPGVGSSYCNIIINILEKKQSIKDYITTNYDVNFYDYYRSAISFRNKISDDLKTVYFIEAYKYHKPFRIEYKIGFLKSQVLESIKYASQPLIPQDYIILHDFLNESIKELDIKI